MLPLLLIAAAMVGNARADQEATERYYCTQYGPFFLRFDDDKLAGVFAILSNGDLGAVVGTLDGNVMTGRWYENDSAGDIVIRFTPDRGAFEAEYRIDGAPADWYREWRGVLRYADGGARFKLGDTDFRCE